MFIFVHFQPDGVDLMHDRSVLFELLTQHERNIKQVLNYTIQPAFKLHLFIWSIKISFFSLLFLRLRKFRVILRYSLLRRALFRHWVMGGVEHKAVLSMPLATVVDIGANRGQFALAARAFSGASVISFEPLPAVAELFGALFSDDPSVALHVSAVGERAEEKVIHLSARDDSSSLLEIGRAQSDLFPGTHEVGTLEVRVGTLDEFLTQQDIVRPAMLKLDVQGFEMQALAGCKSLIGNFDYIYCECSFVELYRSQRLAGEVVTYLGHLGFSLAGVYNPLYDHEGNCIQADLYFVSTWSPPKDPHNPRRY